MAILIATTAAARGAAAQRSDGRLELKVVDSQTNQPLAARMRLLNSRGARTASGRGDRPVRLRQRDVVNHGEFFYLDGQVILPLRRGQYTFDLDAGPEYRTRSGHFEIDRHADDSEEVAMNRFANLADEGWYAGDLALSPIPNDAAELILRAEQLHVAPTVNWKPSATDHSASPQRLAGGRFYSSASGLRLRKVPSCLLFNLSADAELDDGDSELPKIVRQARAVHSAGGNVVAISPLDNHLPALLAGRHGDSPGASGDLDAMLVIAPPELLEDGQLSLCERDTLRYPSGSGTGRFAEHVYFQALEAGIRIAPAAGSSWPDGEPVPPGTARTYVHCGGNFGYAQWWQSLAAGRVMVTNGPLMRPTVQGQPPGNVFRIRSGETIEMEIGLKLDSREPVEYLEIIRDGRVEYDVRLHELAEQGGRLPKLQFTESGWFLLRVVAASGDRYQRAITAPYFVEMDGQRRVSRQAVQFFLDWIDNASEEADEELGAELAWARAFWQQRLAEANAE